MNNEQHYNTRKQTNMLRLNRSLHTLHLVKAVDGFESFSNTSDHPSIKELCLASLFTAPFKNTRTPKFKAQPTNAFFATVNQIFGGSSQLPTRLSELYSTI